MADQSTSQVELWLQRARDDQAMATVLSAAGSPSWGVCYHVPQAVEKALKALLVAAGEDPPKTHNLVRLNAAVRPPPFGVDGEDVLASLTLWSIEQRYPADQPEPTPSEAAEALVFGQAAIESIERRVRERGS